MDSNKMQQEEDSIDLLELLEVLRRHLWIILLCTIAAAVIGFVVVSVFATPQYKSSSMLLVISQQNESGNVTNDMLNSAAKLVETYSVVIRSRTILVPVIEKLDLDYTYSQLAKMVSVSSVNSTSILQITVKSPNKEESLRICECITEIAPDIVKNIVNAGSVNTVENASADDSPVSPHVRRDTLIMAMLGAILSIAVIVVIHLLDNKINTETDVAKYLDLTVLGVIPYYEKEKK